MSVEPRQAGADDDPLPLSIWLRAGLTVPDRFSGPLVGERIRFFGLLIGERPSRCVQLDAALLSQLGLQRSGPTTRRVIGNAQL